MAKYPLSLRSGKVSEFLEVILRQHLTKGARILDPTCSQRLAWKGIDRSDWKVIFSDKVDCGQKIVKDLFDLRISEESLDAVFYDPPFMFGIKQSNDPRKDIYGGYNTFKTYKELESFISKSFIKFQEWLKPGGILIFKCSDQYHVKDRKYYPLHIFWYGLALEHNFILKDYHIYQYHRCSPTAFQVKDRPCSVINYSLFMVFSK